MLPGAFAQNLRSWVSSTGSDSNNCSRSAPCATFQGALANTNSGGEIDVVDAGDYGAVVISQSVTIDGGGMGRIASTAPGHNNFDLGDGIQVTSGNVSLLNLSILPSSGASRGVYVWFGAGSVSIRNVHISGFPEGVTTDGPQTVVTDSLIEGVGTALFCRGTNCAFRNDSLIDNSGYGIKLADAATALIDSCLITNSGVALQSGTGFDSGGTAQLTNTTITNNTVGMQAFGGGSIISFVNNRIYGNGTNGAPTSSVFQK
ncbi:conserved hypothetical protein [Candidatus Sulfopaludibacter sp. SbA3]|nr:conserved hypothetical protein [Candidatus Sulfopaludibacter sp. SbA3]